MRECPECKRIYYDESLNYCLEDGERLFEQPRTIESDTAILPESLQPSEAQTRHQLSRTDEPAISSATQAEYVETKRSIIQSKPWLLPVILLALVVPAAVFAYRYFTNTGTKQIGSIAVLPFENGSGDPNLDYLADGVSESVIDRLSELPQLKVIARGSSFQYRGQVNLKEVATALGVEAIVNGRVSKNGDNYVIRVDVMDVLENRQLWGKNFTRKSSDIQVLQTDISGEIAENLRLRLSSDQKMEFAQRGTVNPQAYELFLKARFFYNNPSAANYRKAAEFYEQAVAADPNFAIAHAELSFALNLVPGNAQVNEGPKELRARAASAARRALQLDENLAESHIAVAGIHMNEWRFTEAENEYKRALELNPRISESHGRYGLYLYQMKRDAESISELRRAVDIDPLSIFWKRLLARGLSKAGQAAEAIEILKELNSIKDNGVLHSTLGSVFYEHGMYPEAIAEYQKAVNAKEDPQSGSESSIGVIYAKMGDRAKAEEILQKRKEANANPRSLISLYAALGQNDKAFAILEDLFADRDPGVTLMNRNVYLEPLRSDPRFADLVRRIGVPL
jgi:eukaryotic-like serine/threonine-protein kinase